MLLLTLAQPWHQQWFWCWQHLRLQLSSQNTLGCELGRMISPVRPFLAVAYASRVVQCY
jgi:hypothetical protein